MSALNSQRQPIEPESGLTPRTRGVLKFAIALPIAVATSIWVASRVHSGRHPGPLEIMGLGLPGAYALVGLLEAITGAPIFVLASKWDSLKGWQRGVIGTSLGLGLLILASFILAFVLG